MLRILFDESRERMFHIAGMIAIVLLVALLSGCGLAFDNPAVPDEKPQIVDENGDVVDLDKAGDDFLNSIGNVVDLDKAGDDFLNSIGNFALGDLNAAMLLAGDKDFDGVAEAAPGDNLAAQCYHYLAGKVSAAGDQRITVAGVVSAFQVARNFRREGGLSDEFKGACGGLIMDVRGQFLKKGIGILGGGIIG